jgi:predicted amidohydrolase YtcJ
MLVRTTLLNLACALLVPGAVLAANADVIAPVTFPNSMRILDSAVNRTTRTGYVLGPDQRISPLLALHAMTLWPAYQHFEQASRVTCDVRSAL